MRIRRLAVNFLEHIYSKVQYAKGAPRIWMEGRVRASLSDGYPLHPHHQ